MEPKDKIASLLICLILIAAFFSVFTYASGERSIRNGSSNSSISSSSSGSDIIRVIITPSHTKKSNKYEITNEISKAKIKRDYGDSFSATISKKEFQNLKKDSRISKIEIIPTKNLFLQDSVPLINATLIHSTQINGFNLTGIGQTVCIIDAGVNYTHPDLGGCFGNNNASSTCKVIGGIDYCADDDNCTTSDNNPMDVNGHGTHVSGIVAANGSINGVAPGAKIIMIKASNSAGSFYDDDLRAAIDWCVDNSSIFNISVISMSLGSSTVYSSYCDYQDDPMNITLAINNAVAKNISVVIATGNAGDYADISSPACITNATPVGSSTKSDLISTFSNTNSIVQLLAPGSSINSTYLGASGYGVLSGTSMATPHVAGAILIINQYLKQFGQTKTPSQIETLLNNTGKRIQDVGFSELNFSRINIYAAILSLPMGTPLVGLLSPANNTFTLNNITNFSCSASGLNLTNTTLYIWNATALVYNQTKNISGTLNTTTFNYTLPSETGYYWNCRSSNNNSVYSFASSNFSVTYDVTSPNITLISPADGYSETSSSATLAFSYNATDANNVSNCSLIVNGTVNTVNTTVNSSSITSTFSAGSYVWSINCSDFAGNIANSSNRNFTITAPAAVPPATGGGGGGGGGGPSTSTYVPSDNQLVLGYTNQLDDGDAIKFDLSSESATTTTSGTSGTGSGSHTLTMGSIGQNSVDVVIRSSPINVTLYVGEEKKLNISSSQIYDLYLKLNSIINNQANLTIKAISEPIKVLINQIRNISTEPVTTENPANPTDNPLTKLSSFFENAKIYIYAGISIIIAIFVYLLIKKRAHKVEPNKLRRKKR